MEAVPRLPMLSFQLKSSPEAPSFGPKLKSYIRDAYNEDPELYLNEIANLERMRAAAANPSKSVNGCALLKQYYSQLHFLQSRFPLTKDSAIAITFTWLDLYGQLAHASSDIRFEMVSILHNIGALHSQLGASDARQTSEDMKMCCSHFQCAAWAFQQIHEFVPVGVSNDLTQPLQRFQYNVMLAQAQECILEKSMLDSRKPLITAKVAMQIVDYYNTVNNIMDNKQDTPLDELVGSKIFKGWKKYVRLKMTYYRCIALLYQGQQAEEQQKMGERVVYYQKASDVLQEAIKLGKNMDNVQETLTFTADVVEGKKKAAKNENEFIYHEQVPDIETLFELKGASLVKGIPFDINDPEISGPDIFARLVPLQAHEASSLYSEEKAKLRRRMGEQIDEKDIELAAFMSSLQLDHLSVEDDLDQIPQELMDRCAAMNARPNAIIDLIEIMNKLSDTYHDVDSMLIEITELLELESTREREYQAAMGSRAPSIAATDLTREAAKYREAHAKASESNRTLHKAIKMHVGNLKTLGLPLAQLIDCLPKIKEPEDAEEADASLQHMRTLVDKVEEMRRQRSMLNNELRNQTSRDDITNQIVTANEPLDALFNKEMSKHQKLVTLIQQNLSAQENILKALTDAYALHVVIRRPILESQRRRDAVIANLIASSDAYDDLLTKSNKGLEFYRKLETNVTKLLQRVKGTCKVQDEEREQILIKNNKKISSQEMTASPKKSASSGPKLKDYLASMNAAGLGTGGSPNKYPPSVRPAPVGSEAAISDCDAILASKYTPTTSSNYPSYPQQTGYSPVQTYPASYGAYSQPTSTTMPSSMTSTNNPIGSNPYNNPTYPASQPSGAKTPAPAASYPDQGQTQGVNPAAYASPANYHTPSANPYPVPSNEPYPSYQAQVAPESTPNYQNPQTQAYSGYSYPSGYAYPNATPQSTGTPTNYPAPAEPVYQAAASSLVTRGHPYQTPASHLDQSYPMPGGQMTHQPAVAATQQYQTPVAQNYPTQAIPPVYSYNPSFAMSQNYLGHYPSATQPSYSTIAQADQSALNMTTTFAHSLPSTNDSTASNTYQVNSSMYQNYPANNQTGPSTPSPSPSPSKQATYHNSPVHQATPTTQTTTDHGYMYQQEPQTPTNNYQYPYGYNNNASSSSSSASALQHSYQQSWASYGGHPGYSFDTTSGQYLYSSGYSTQGVSSGGGYRQAGIADTATHSSGAPNPNDSSSGQSSAAAYYSAPYGQQQPQQTYVQAGLATPATTPSSGNGTGNASNAETTPGGANIDLLAGIDFSPQTPPLVPQTKPLKPETNSQKVESPISPCHNVSSTCKQFSTAPIPNAVVTDEKRSSIPSLASAIEVATPGSNPLPSSTPSSTSAPKPPPDPYEDPEVVDRLGKEIDALEKLLEGSDISSRGGPLDMKWQGALAQTDRIVANRGISVARCYPMKNRSPDVLPYDWSRVELPSTKDDYINASLLESLTPGAPPLILTQSPMAATLADFWTMIWQQQVELIVCLVADTELGNEAAYWPKDKSDELSAGRWRVSLQSANVQRTWTERILSLMEGDSRATRVVVHLQMTGGLSANAAWSTPNVLAEFLQRALYYYTSQRSLAHRVCVHGWSEDGRSTCFALAAAALTDLAAGRPLFDLDTGLAKLGASRRAPPAQRKDHWRLAYKILLFKAKEFLNEKRGGCILADVGQQESLVSGGGGAEAAARRTHSRDSSLGGGAEATTLAAIDPLSLIDPLWPLKRH